MSEAALVTIIGLFFRDRFLKEETRKKYALVFMIVLIGLMFNYLKYGINFDSVPVGDLSIPSRRYMTSLFANIFILVMSAIAIMWFILTDSETRKRGLAMYLVMAAFIAWWTLWEWLSGQRWIEVGSVSNGVYSDPQKAPPIIEFLALIYDYIMEISLIYVPFLTIPCVLGLIKLDDV